MATPITNDIMNGIVCGEVRRILPKMIQRIRELLNQTPFLPFTIHTSGGRSIRVPTRDHIALSGTFYVIVTHDDGKWDYIPALHMAGVTVDEPQAV